MKVLPGRPRQGDSLLLDHECFGKIAGLGKGSRQRVEIARPFAPCRRDGPLGEPYGRRSIAPQRIRKVARDQAIWFSEKGVKCSIA